MEHVTLTIDGKEVQAKPGTTVLEAARSAGIEIPTLCYQKDLTITGACRLCVVEIEKAKNMPSACAMPVAEGMVVKTNTEKVRNARKLILELMWANHRKDCLTCESNGSCKLQDYCYQYGVSDTRFDGDRIKAEIDDTSRFVERDIEKCILCGKCIRVCHEIQGTGAIDFMDRGFDTKVATFFDKGLKDSSCVDCGNCVQVCPVGALTEKPARGKGRDYDLKKVKTTCPYCGVGCGINLMIKDNEIVKVEGDDDSTVNHGYLCVKGRFGTGFVNSDQRLKSPLIRKNGKLMETTWDEALNFIASKLQNTKKKYGPDSIGFLASAKCTNEENYLIQKFARTVIGTNSIDHCARL